MYGRFICLFDRSDYSNATITVFPSKLEHCNNPFQCFDDPETMEQLYEVSDVQTRRLGQRLIR